MAELKELDTKSLILDMTTDLSRVANFALSKNIEKTIYFANQLGASISELETRDYDNRLQFWIDRTNELVKTIKSEEFNNKEVADDSLTNAVVLQNRAIYLL